MQRTSARPIRLPTREIRTLAKKLAQKLHRMGLPKPGRVMAEEWLDLSNVRGEEIGVEVQLAGSPGQQDPFKPHQELIQGGYMKRRPGLDHLIMVFVNPRFPSFAHFPRQMVEQEIYRILTHELTHAADIWSGKGSGQHALGKSKEEFKRLHHNHPAEVKSLMRDVVTDVEPTVQEYLDVGMPFNMAVRAALEDSRWVDIEPYLNPKNRKTILKGVFTHLQDQGLDRVAGETFYREQSGPADSEVKQPGEGVDYHADSPSTYQVGPGRKNKGIPPGNPGHVNLPERDSMNPSSGKVIPTQMTQTLQDQVTYVNTASVARVARRHRTAATIDDILGETGPMVHQRSQGLAVKQRRFNPDTGFWGFTVMGSSGTPYYVRIKGVRKTKSIKKLSQAQVKCSCSCPFWRWQGPEHWGKQNGFLYGRPRGTASFPVIRDPKEKHWACKHLLAVLETARGYRFASEQGWSLEGEIVPMADPGAVAARYALTLGDLVSVTLQELYSEPDVLPG